MTTAIAPSTTTTTTGTPTWKAAAASGVVAAVASTGVAALGHLAGASLEVTGAPGEPIPYLGFAQLTLVGALIGLAIAAVVRRWTMDPARTFTRITVALTVVSCIPSAAMGAGVATKVTLVLTHLVAAAVVVPAVARTLDR